MKDRLKEIIKAKLRESTEIKTEEDPIEDEDEKKRQEHPNRISKKEKENRVLYVKEYIQQKYSSYI